MEPGQTSIHCVQFCRGLLRPRLLAKHLMVHKVMSMQWFRRRCQSQKSLVRRPANLTFLSQTWFPPTWYIVVLKCSHVIYIYGMLPMLLARLASLLSTWRSTWRAWPWRAVQLARCWRVSVPRLLSLNRATSYMDACMGYNHTLFTFMPA